jgi:hypothetical protein
MKVGWLSLVSAGIISLLAFSMPSAANANDGNRQTWRELRKDRNELERDRRDLSRLYRKGGSREDIYRKKAEIRDDLREIGQGRRQLGRYDGNRGDRYRWYDTRGRWNRNDSGWWNWGRASDRDRWRSDYRHD